MIEIDIETRSAAPLPRCGVYVYAEHTTTHITHVGYSIDRGPLRCWLPLLPAGWTGTTHTIDGRPVDLIGGPGLPSDLAAAIGAGVVCVAHNASFERTLLSGAPGARLGFPSALRDPARWICTAARAARCGLPRTLEGACAALGLPVQKDKEGHALMMRMCKPDPRTGAWVGTGADMIREAAYCAHDVAAEIGLLDTLPPLSEFETRVWCMTESMNDRGVLVDLPLVDAVAALVSDATRSLNARLSAVTGGAVARVTDHMALTRWLRSVDADDSGLGDDGVGKAALAAMLERTDLAPAVRDALTIRRDGGKSSAAKYKAIRERVSADGRIRGVLVYCGAAATGRFSSRGAQLHNLPRAGILRKADTVRHLIRDIHAGADLATIESVYGPPLVLAAELLRPVFTASPGRSLARGDSAQIEARVLPWLAGQEETLAAFRAYDAGTGPDIYKVNAASMTGIPLERLDENTRQTGKVAVLSLGFQGGAGALQAMARGYGIKIPRAVRPADDPEWTPPAGTDEWIKAAWRAANPSIVGLWDALERAALDCMESAPGAEFFVGPRYLRFKRSRHALALRLPSGTSLLYWNPRLVRRLMPWGKYRTGIRFRAEDSQTKRWAEFDAYGGFFAQNATQATARDLMAWWLLEMDAAGLAPVLTVHDEGIADAPLPPAEAAGAVRRIMAQVPPWAAGLPVSADASGGPRYMKG